MELGGFQWEICFCVKGISYLEIKTQLLTFWKDMVVHQSKYHLVLQNGPGSKKVDGGDWGGDFQTFSGTENFFSDRGTHQPYRNFCHERFVYSHSSCSRNSHDLENGEIRKQIDPSS